MVNFLAKGALETLTQRFRESLPAKVAKLTMDVAAYLASPGDLSRGEIAVRSAHSLVGSSGTYGFLDICHAARRAERILREALEGAAAPPPETRARLRELVESLLSLAAAAATQSGGAGSNPVRAQESNLPRNSS